MTSPKTLQAPTGAAWRIAPFAVLIAFVALEQLLQASAWADAVDWRWVTVARAGVVALVLAACWRHLPELRATARPAAGKNYMGAWGQAALAIAGGLAVFAVWIAFDHGWAVVRASDAAFVPLDREGRLEPWLFTLRLAGFALVVPVAEEVFWRSFFLRWIDRKRFAELDPRAASAKAFAICSVLFALEHSQWFAGLVAGAVYTGIYTRTGNLRVPIVSHAITNATLGLWILATRQWHFW